MSQSQNAPGSLLRDVALGMLAGLAGTVALDRTSTLLYQRESEELKQRESRAGGGAPYDVMAAKILDSLGLERTEPACRRLGQAIHWGYGMAWGGLLGALHHRAPALTRAGGLPYALGLWLVADEVLPVAAGIAAPPQEYPLETHMRGLAAHTAYTVATEAVYQGLVYLADQRSASADQEASSEPEASPAGSFTCSSAATG